MTAIRRRDLFAGGAAAVGVLALGPSFWREALAAPATVADGPYGPLQPADANGLMLPQGFRSRELARGGTDVAGYRWHPASDGQATFAQPDGGWVLVSNAETSALQGGGTSALRFDAQGEVTSAYRICEGTTANCAGGRTPWGTWLTCEEWGGGQVWECDPRGERDAVVRPALGTFNHEAVTVDHVQRRLYLTEDEGDGCFYRFTPDAYPDLTSGRLEVAVVSASNTVSWRQVPDPLAVLVSTRKQVRTATTFRGGEGIWFDEGFVYFTTKGDHTLWAYDTVRRTLERLYDPATSGNGDFLHGPDNLTVARSGDVFVCEDNGDDEFDIVMVTPERTISPVVRASSTSGIHRDSEFAGIIFSPDGERMYFSSQRGQDGAGVVYEVTGPFRAARPVDPGEQPEEPQQPQQPLEPQQPEAPQQPLEPRQPEAPQQPGPPQQPVSRPARTRPIVTVEDVDAPGLRIAAASKVTLAALRSQGLAVTVQVDERATLSAVLRTSQLASTPGQRGSEERPVDVVLGRAGVTAPAGRRRLVLKLSAREVRRVEGALAALRRRGRTPQLRARLSVQAKDAAGNVRIATRAVLVTAPPAPKRGAAAKSGAAF